jgi:glycerol-3-phosphate acyltransferase PlsX
VIRVGIDAMGGDDAPSAEVDGVALALRELPPDFTITMVGRTAEIEKHLERHPGIDRTRLSIVDAPDVIGMAEKPLAAVRKKPKSSLVTGLGLHAAGGVDAFLSAGNTGATLAAATLILGLYDGVERATVASLFPTADEFVLVLDSGANVDCSSRELVNFARLGAIYARDVLKRPEPRVGLLNVGEEEGKGGAVLRETHLALKELPRITYVGNIEGRDIVVPHPRHGRIDVVVCDGYVGNVVLKFYESMGKLLGQVLSRQDPDLLKSDVLRPIVSFLDASQYGGAPLLGVQGITIICHGHSDARSIRAAIRQAVGAVSGGLRKHIAAELEALKSSAPA